jgi:hypothetical protein
MVGARAQERSSSMDPPLAEGTIDHWQSLRFIGAWADPSYHRLGELLPKQIVCETLN